MCLSCRLPPLSISKLTISSFPSAAFFDAARNARMSFSPGILLTTYASHSAQGRNLGSAGYSYDFVVRQFLPLLAQCGTVIEVPPDRGAIDHEADRLRRRGVAPLHLCFMP